MRELADELTKRGQHQHVEAMGLTVVPILPPTMLPQEASLDAPRRTVWALPAVGVALVLVAMVSVLATLYYTGRTGSKPVVGSAVERVSPKSVASFAPAAIAGSPVVAPVIAPPPATPEPDALAIVPSFPDETDDALEDGIAVQEPSDEPNRRRKRSRRSSKRDQDDKDDEDDERAEAPKPGYSLYAALNKLDRGAAPKRVARAGSVAAGVTPGTATSRPRPRPSTTLRMLKAAASGPSKNKATSPRLPSRLTASAVTRALRRVRGSVQSCLRRFGFAHATVRLRVTVAGATGRVLSARAVGRFSSSPAGRCAVRQARKLRFGRFSGKSQTVLLPIRSR